MGGAVEIRDYAGRIRDAAGLPQSDFELVSLDLVGTNAVPTDLARLSPLGRLRDLHLPGPIWNRNADGGKDLSGELGHLATVKTLETITFSYHFLDNIRFKDDGIEKIGGLRNLRELVVRQTAIKGHALAPFRRLESLDATLSQFDDEGLRTLEGRTSLRRLRLGDTFITDEGSRAFSGLKRLRELDLHGTDLSDAGIRNLSDLTGLQKLNLMGTALTDAGLDYLKGLRNIEELNLYRTRITNAGLEKLHGLTALREIDVRYTRVTRAGVERLQAVLPNVRVVFFSMFHRGRRG